MNARERIQAAAGGGRPDHLPASFWGHDYASEITGEGLAAQTIQFQREFGWDVIKINPRAQYHVEDWGVRYEYPAPPGSKCVRTDFPLRTPADWQSLRPLDPEKAASLREHLDAVATVCREFPDVPVLMTVFNPLSVLKYASDSEHEVVRMAREHPRVLRAALDAVRDTYRAFASAAMARGASGLFYATTAFACTDLWTPGEYREWSRDDDFAVLGAASAGGATFQVLHVCRARNFLPEFEGYPVHATSWATPEEGNPTLGQGDFVPGARMGGIRQEEALQAGEIAGLREEWDQVIRQTGGRRCILAPGCSIPPETPRENLHLLREWSQAFTSP